VADAPRARVVATLGARLGPQWDAAALVAWAQHVRGRRPLDAHEVRDALPYLLTVLDETFTGVDEPPAPARLHDERRRQLVDDERAEMRAAQAAWRAQLDERDQAAAGADSPGRAAARAAAARARGDR